MNTHAEMLNFFTPPRVMLADGLRHRVAALCARQGWRHALIVTDSFFSQHTPWVGELRDALLAAGLRATVYDGGVPDPSAELCDEATATLRADAANSSIDHLIALGGGSNIDLAKAMSLTLKFDRPAAAFVGSPVFPGKPLPLVALPTTAGTGSEITPGAILTQRSSATKVAIMGNDLRPAMALIDPEYTLRCPPRVTADAGVDALTHAIESWLGTDAEQFDTGGDPDPGYSGRNPITLLFAREAVALVFRHLPTAFEEPDNRAARRGMAQGSLFAALSYASAGLHAVHGLAYALAGLTHDTHGSTNAVFLPYVMDELRGLRNAELADIARLAGAAAAPSETLAGQAGLLTRQLIERVGLRTTLPAFGVSADQLPALVQDALGVTRLAKAFPIQPPGAAYQRIVQRAYDGHLAGPAG